ncbi:MAG: hypothetical protein SynsKO_34810 [Synoicihabitans sp.]
MAKNWQQLVATVPTRAYQRQAKTKSRLLARYVPHDAFRQSKRPTYLFASGNLNRCNPSGVACIYFGEGPETAKAEFDSYYRRPLTELGYYARTRLKAILDLTEHSTRAHFGLKPDDFTRSYAPRSGLLIPLQEIGLALTFQSRISAIRFPSNAMHQTGKIGTNLVIFQDLLGGSDQLKIIEGNRVLERWPK